MWLNPVFSRCAPARIFLFVPALLLLSLLTHSATESIPAEEAEGRLIPLQDSPSVNVTSVLDSPADSAAATPMEVVRTDPPPGQSISPIIALLDFESSTLTSGEQKALTQAVWARLHRLGNIRMMPRSPTRSWLIRNDLHPIVPYQQAILPNQVVRALNVDYLLTGHVDQIQGLFVADYTVFSRRAGRAIHQDVQWRRADLEQMLDAFEEMAAEMWEMIQADHQGLEVLGAAPPIMTEEVARTIPAVLHKAPSEQSKTRVREASIITDLPPDVPAREPPPEPTPATEQPAVSTPPPEPEPAPTVTVPAQTPETEATPTIEKPAEETPQPIEQPPEPEIPQTRQQAEPTASPEPAAEKTEPDTQQPPTDEDKKVNQLKAMQIYEEALTLERGSQERLDKLVEAARIDPEQNLFHRMLANEYYHRKLYEQCVTHCDKALKSHPNDSMLLTIKASALFNLDRLAEARVANEQAVAADPENLWALYNLGLTLTVLESTEEAVAVWRTYLEKAEDDPTHNELKLIDDARDRLAELENPPD